MATLICWWGQRCIYAFFSKFVCFVLQNIAVLEGFLSVFKCRSPGASGGFVPSTPTGALPLDPTRGPLAGPWTPGREKRELRSLRSLHFARGIFLKSVITPLNNVFFAMKWPTLAKPTNPTHDFHDFVNFDEKYEQKSIMNYVCI